jgi:hypothetical protein
LEAEIDATEDKMEKNDKDHDSKNKVNEKVVMQVQEILLKDTINPLLQDVLSNRDTIKTLRETYATFKEEVKMDNAEKMNTLKEATNDAERAEILAEIDANNAALKALKDQTKEQIQDIREEIVPLKKELIEIIAHEADLKNKEVRQAFRELDILGPMKIDNSHTNKVESIETVEAPGVTVEEIALVMEPEMIMLPDPEPKVIVSEPEAMPVPEINPTPLPEPDPVILPEPELDPEPVPEPEPQLESGE